jgi:hypothetical protein
MIGVKNETNRWLWVTTGHHDNGFQIGGISSMALRKIAWASAH